VGPGRSLTRPGKGPGGIGQEALAVFGLALFGFLGVLAFLSIEVILRAATGTATRVAMFAVPG